MGMTQRRDRVLTTRVTDDEMAHVELAAKRAGQSRSSHTRTLLLSALGLDELAPLEQAS